jgi:hypothetical protein
MTGPPVDPGGKMTMKKSYYLRIPNQENVLAEARNALSGYDLTVNNFWYPQDLPEMPLLDASLREMRLDSQVDEIAVTVSEPGFAQSVHVDTGDFDWSLNLPVWDSEQSMTLLFETELAPKELLLPNGISYLGFDPDDEMREAGRIPGNQPLLLYVKTPHQVVNQADGVRVMLLIRLKSSFDIDSIKPHLA